MRIVLIGPRGCGKTSVGRMLARQMACAFIDLDDLAAAQFEEPSISEIWAKHGEAAWRAAEVRALTGVLEQEDPVSATEPQTFNKVIALGGGTPMIPEAREALLAEKQRGLRVVYLKCPVDMLAKRLTRQPGDRPSITGRGAAEEIAHVLAEREPAYEAMADRVVNAAHDVERVVESVLRAELHKHGPDAKPAQ